MADSDILARLSSFIDYESPELAEFVYRMIEDQGNAITYRELRQAIFDGGLSLDYLRQWQQDYSRFINEAYSQAVERAIAQAAADLRTEYGVNFYDPMFSKIDNFIQTHGGQLIRQVSIEQYTAINQLVRQATLTTSMTVDQLARVIRPCVGLTRRQAQTTKNFYDSLIKDGYSDKRARERQLVYAAKIHRQRAAMIAETEMATAYNAGWQATIQQNVEDGILPPGTRKQWLTAEDEKVCPICGGMREETVLWNEPFSNGSDYPPAHPRCRCHYKIIFVDLLQQPEYATDPYAQDESRMMEAAAQEEEYIDDDGPAVMTNPTRTGIIPNEGLLPEEYGGIIGAQGEQLRRYVADDGHEIIDQPTYNKLTKPFINSGGTIIRGEEADRYLEGRGNAAYIAGGNIAFIKDDATVSDVLEEMYHAKQERRGDYAGMGIEEMMLRREIDAQKYLLRSIKRYKIPPTETAATKKILELYKKQLARIISKGRWRRGIFKLFDHKRLSGRDKRPPRPGA